MSNIQDRRTHADLQVYRAMKEFNHALSNLQALFPGSTRKVSLDPTETRICGYYVMKTDRKVSVWKALLKQADPVSTNDIPCSEGYFELRQMYSATELLEYSETIESIRRNRKYYHRLNDRLSGILDAMGWILSYAGNRIANGEEDEWFDEYVTMFVPEPA